MNQVTPIPTRVIPWPIPLPAGATPATVSRMINEAMMEVSRLEATSERLREVIRTYLRQEIDGYEEEDVADAIHERVVLSSQDRGILNTEWRGRLNEYIHALTEAAYLLPEWVPVVFQLGALDEALDGTERNVANLVNEEIDADISRRMSCHSE